MGHLTHAAVGPRSAKAAEVASAHRSGLYSRRPSRRLSALAAIQGACAKHDMIITVGVADPAITGRDFSEAWTVLQGAILMLRAGNAANFSKLEVFSLIVAAAVHDLAHPGDSTAVCFCLAMLGLGTTCRGSGSQAASALQAPASATILDLQHGQSLFTCAALPDHGSFGARPAVRPPCNCLSLAPAAQALRARLPFSSRLDRGSCSP